MSNDSVSDVLTRIRNAQRAGHKVVQLPVSNVAKGLVDLLKQEGFVDGFATKETESFPVIEVYLKYLSSGEPVIGKATRVSKPGRRVYMGWEEIPLVKNGLGIAVVSTSQGLMSDREARKRKVGGEVWALVG